ncbi:MAG: dihydrofolate reductase family protein, partial [Armatimonadetes bacterium]|nr:dihydrofolate reductase family protein [Armatimonadota bacterium]
MSAPIQRALRAAAVACLTLVACAGDASDAAEQRLASAGVELFRCAGATHSERLESLLVELGRRRMTNILVEGGSRLLGSLLDARLIDEVHLFIAPKIVGGQ